MIIMRYSGTAAIYVSGYWEPRRFEYIVSFIEPSNIDTGYARVSECNFVLNSIILKMF